MGIYAREVFDRRSLAAFDFRLKLAGLPRIRLPGRHRVGGMKVRIRHLAAAETAKFALDRVRLATICTLIRCHSYLNAILHLNVLESDTLA
jgi:hypothetical protein